MYKDAIEEISIEDKIKRNKKQKKTIQKFQTYHKIISMQYYQ